MPRRGSIAIGLVVLSGAATLALSGCTAAPTRAELRSHYAARDMEIYWARAPQIDVPVTLADALRLADAHNIDTWIAAQERRVQEELATQATLKMLPQLLAGYEASRRTEYDAATAISLESGEQSLEPSYASEKAVRRFDVGATWSLLDFGISYLRARQQASRVNIAAERERRVRQNLALEVTRAYWQAVTARVIAAEAESAAAEVDALLEKIRAEVAEQTISELDGLKRETMFLEQREELRRYQRTYLAARAELATLMGLPPGTTFELAAVDLDAAVTPLSDSTADLEWEALLTRPELFEKDLEQTISRDEAHLAIVQMFPNLTGFWRFDFDANKYLAFNEWHTAGVRISWDLLSIPGRIAQYKASQLQTDLVVQRRTAIAVAILTQLHLALIDYQDAAAQYGASNDIATKRADLVHAVESAAENGKSHAGELLDYRLKFLKARAKALSTYANLHLARARVLNTVGRDVVPPATPPEDQARLPDGSGWEDPDAAPPADA